MPLLPDEWVQELLNRVDIREVVERYVPLQAKGSRYWACCPFHNDKTPSFSVTPDRGMFYCYGCHKGGTAINFVSEIEKLNFREACEKLAEGCGLELPSESFTADRLARRQEISRIKEANIAAARFYVNELYSPDGTEALAYLHSRGLSDRDIRRNGIGYAPDDWQKTGGLLKSRGFDSALLHEAGLQKKKNGRSYDVFRGRVMFPIIDTERSVVGFGGRVMDSSLPKYLNSPETPVFNKSRQMYHLNVLRQLKTVPYIILMEGYMDVISADSFGLLNTVATLGTAITIDQARLLKRWNVPVYICYDGDLPGLKAAERAIAILEKAGLSCRVIALPDGMDPDEYLRKKGRSSFDEQVASALEPMRFRFKRAEEGLDLTTPDGKERYVAACVAMLGEQQSSVGRERFARLLSEQTGYSFESIMKDVERGSHETAMPAFETRSSSAGKQQEAALRAENYLALYASLYPEDYARTAGKLEPADFTFGPDAAIITAVLGSLKEGVEPTPERILSVMENEADRSHAARLFSELDRLTAVGESPELYAAGCVARLLLRRTEKERDLAMLQLKECRNSDERVNLKRRIQELTAKVQELKRGRLA